MGCDEKVRCTLVEEALACIYPYILTTSSTARESKVLLGGKISGPQLLVHSVRSLDDAIDVANRCIRHHSFQDEANHRLIRNGPLLASYSFAEPKSGKYLSQFIPSGVSFVNQIPIQVIGES